MRIAIHPILPLLPLLPILLSCGTKEKPDASVTEDYFPLEVGDTWLYQEDDGTEVTQILYEVTEKIDYDFEYDELGPLSVFVVRNSFPSGDSGSDTDAAGGWRVQYYLDDGTRIDRLRHEVYDDDGVLTKTRDYVDGFLRFDRAKVETDEWAEEFTRYTDSTPENTADEIVVDETSYLYEVMGFVTVTVPAGEFNCVEWKRTETDASGEIKLYYYAPGVGKVMEITGDKTEKLVSATVGGVAYGGV